MKAFKKTSNNSIFSVVATRWALLLKNRSWPNSIFRDALELLETSCNKSCEKNDQN
jgi:hypothetical protein